MVEFVLIKQESPEWEKMWSYVEQHPINEGIENPSVALNRDESWRYMGSMSDGKRIIHRMRHLCHPYNNDVQELSFNGTENFNNDIERRFKV